MAIFVLIPLLAAPVSASKVFDFSPQREINRELGAK